MDRSCTAKFDGEAVVSPDIMSYTDMVITLTFQLKIGYLLNVSENSKEVENIHDNTNELESGPDSLTDGTTVVNNLKSTSKASFKRIRYARTGNISTFA